MPVLQHVRRKLRGRFRHRLDRAVDRWPLVGTLLGYKVTDRGYLDSLAEICWEYDPRSVIGNLLFTHGTFEEFEIRFFAKLLSNVPRPVILDIGANIGVHTVRWARELHDPSIYAFEPSKTTAELLASNVLRNGVADRVEVIRNAVSNYCGTSNFFHCEDDAYSSLRDTNRKAVVDQYPVDVTSIDAFAKARALSRIDLIKIDVEGLEGGVIEGGRETLLNLRPYLFVEIFGGRRSNPDPEGTVALVRSLGYEAFVLKGGAATAFSKHADADFNYFFQPTQ